MRLEPRTLATYEPFLSEALHGEWAECQECWDVLVPCTEEYTLYKGWRTDGFLVEAKYVCSDCKKKLKGSEWETKGVTSE